MNGITIKIPQEIVLTMKLPGSRVKECLLLELAVSLYNQNILSFGKARNLCKMTKWEFQKELGLRKISRHYEEINLEEDIDFAYSR